MAHRFRRPNTTEEELKFHVPCRRVNQSASAKNFTREVCFGSILTCDAKYLTRQSNASTSKSKQRKDNDSVADDVP